MDTPSITWTFVALLFFSSIAIAQDVAHPAKETVQALGPVEILTDTQGVDFGSYLQKVVQDVKRNWYQMIPESAMPPIKRRGKLAIEFAIRKDGKVSNMMLKATSGDTPLDRAAWSAITFSNTFAPLPSEFPGHDLRLRVYFYYNPKPEDLGSDKSWVNSAPPPTAQVVKNQRPALTPKQLAELRVKCVAYTSTTVEDLKSKRVALPPHECVGVLGWMRDSRVEELYLPEKSAQ
jgi:TonB family protein